MKNNSKYNFINVIRRPSVLNNNFLKSFDGVHITRFINGAQKVINIYNGALPIIKQYSPMLSNIKTTFKVARAFSKMYKTDEIEKAFDELPDYYTENKTTTKKVENPFYP